MFSFHDLHININVLPAFVIHIVVKRLKDLQTKAKYWFNSCALTASESYFVWEVTTKKIVTSLLKSENFD